MQIKILRYDENKQMIVSCIENCTNFNTAVHSRNIMDYDILELLGSLESLNATIVRKLDYESLKSFRIRQSAAKPLSGNIRGKFNDYLEREYKQVLGSGDGLNFPFDILIMLLYTTKVKQ